MTRHLHSCGHVHDCEAPDPAAVGALHSRLPLDLGTLQALAVRAVAGRLRYPAAHAVLAVVPHGGDVLIRLNSGGNALAVEAALAPLGYMTTSEDNPDGYGVAVRVYGPPSSPYDTEAPPAAPSVPTDLATVIYTAWTGQPHWGGCDQREAVERTVDAVVRSYQDGAR